MQRAQVLVGLLSDACSSVSEAQHQSILLDHTVGGPCDEHAGAVQRLRACLQSDDWLMSHAHRGLVSIANTWTAGVPHRAHK